jgi:ribosomal-protein-alanine N-acetyltransferase
MIYKANAIYIGVDEIKEDAENKIIIRRYERKDLREIITIEKHSFTTPWSPEMFSALHSINPKGFYIVKRDSQVIAYAIVLNEPHIAGTEIRKIAHLINLAVHPDFRKQGIGRHLVEKVQKDMRDSSIDKMLLEVRRSNTDALEFYSKLLFKRVGMIEGFYLDEDAIVMSKDIM